MAIAAHYDYVPFGSIPTKRVVPPSGCKYPFPCGPVIEGGQVKVCPGAFIEGGLCVNYCSPYLDILTRGCADSEGVGADLWTPAVEGGAKICFSDRS